ncbi:MCM2/3/5 family protein [Tritrichomonas foetus]|uniref:DNA replication licensing factor MCM3 n=1 Tax=Tritrichomonas foetus TaxID=1144522 RepID=A0A1J4K6D2_9EUKA|nr:MCM2/3/5 family protein [Tritrichomonas foetus]|eukprot:OHT06440.1 MCM2/3/5 family protein [Tritrichomonas foetus]
MTTQPADFWQVPQEELDLNKTSFYDFFDAKTQELGLNYNYKEVVSKGLDDNKKRLLISLDDLREYDKVNNSNLAQKLITNPRTCLEPLENAFNEFAGFVYIDPEHFQVGVTGQIGDHLVTPRQLSSRFLSQMICLDGIVTKTSLVNPKLVKSAQYCPETNQFITRTFNDATSMNDLPSRLAIPTTDLEGHQLEMEFGRSTFIDHQLITIQERPETAPAGQMPRSCDVIADNDLADACKPGDRVKIYGVYRILSSRVTGSSTGIYRAMVIANNIEISNQSVALELTDNEISQIQAVAHDKGPSVASLLSRSIAPSIYGHEQIKKALMMLLVGGTECNLNDGTHIRGDINVLMVGDPSTAKSQLLRHVLSVAPLAVHTTGRGSSGVGLTASVSSDPETGERRLEAGAMVIADRGVVCIDEFDKMEETDRVVIHEALEQQTVTISKAGIHTSLHARCSVCAAANPVWGNYNPNRSPMENVGLPDSLLSRFDLLFIVLDQHNPQMDATIADHVLKTHRWRGQTVEFTNGIYIQPDPLLHGSDEQEFLSVDFLKKYVAYAKTIEPVLEQRAIDKLVAEFADLRSVSNRKTQPITPRAFETLIRLATANAKLRLSKKITAKDAEDAISLLRFAIYGKVDEKKVEEEEEVHEEFDEEEEVPEKSSKKKKTTTKKATEKKKAQPKKKAEPKKKDQPKDTEEIDPAVLDKAMKDVFAYISKTDRTEISVHDFMDIIEKNIKYRPTKEEITSFIDRNQDIALMNQKDNKIYTY